MDDYSPAPIAPGLEFAQVEDDNSELVAQDQRIAKAYFHPAWAGVEDMFMEKIEALRIGCTDTSLDPIQYTVSDQGDKKAAATLTEILMRVKNAVQSTESRKGE